nr:hypothetical protein CFP56_29315 [Quercus suber]
MHRKKREAHFTSATHSPSSATHRLLIGDAFIGDASASYSSFDLFTFATLPSALLPSTHRRCFELRSLTGDASISHWRRVSSFCDTSFDAPATLRSGDALISSALATLCLSFAPATTHLKKYVKQNPKTSEVKEQSETSQLCKAKENRESESESLHASDSSHQSLESSPLSKELSSTKLFFLSRDHSPLNDINCTEDSLASLETSENAFGNMHGKKYTKQRFETESLHASGHYHILESSPLSPEVSSAKFSFLGSTDHSPKPGINWI